MRSRAQTSLWSLFLIIFIDMLGIGVVIPILPIIFFAKDFFPPTVSKGMIDVLLGLLIASYSIAQFFAAPVLGKYSDRYGRKKLLLISLCGTLIGYVLFAVAILISNVYLLFISRIIDGITGGNVSIVNSAIADISDATNKTKNFGMIGMAFGLGFILGPFLGGVLSDAHVVSWFSLATPFWAAALLVFANILFVVFGFRESLKQKTYKKINFFSSVRDIVKVINIKVLNIIFLAIFLMSFGWTFFTQFFQLFLYNKFSFSSSQIGYLFAYMGLWIALVQGVVIRPVSVRYRPEKILRIALLATAVILIAFLVPEKSFMLFLLMPFLALFFGFINPNFSTIISDATDEKAQGEVLGLRQSVVSLSQAIPPILAGFALTISASMPILISSIFLFISWLVFFFFYKQTKNKFTFAH